MPKTILPITVIVPNNFTAADHVPLKTTRKDELVDAMNYVVAQILLRMMSEKGRDEYTDTGYISLSTKILDGNIGRSYIRAIKHLTDGKVIEVDRRFIIGSKTRGYRLLPEFLRGHKEVQIKTHLTKNRLRSPRKQRKKQTPRSQLIISIASKWLYDPAFKNNHKAETQYFIENLKYQLLARGREYVTSNKKDESWHREIQYRVASRFFCQKFYLDQLETKKFEINQDDKGGRIYHPFTSIFKELRHFYTYDGQPLASLDIKTSQPYLTLALLNKDFWRTTTTNSLYKISRDLYKDIKTRTDKTLSGIITLLDSLVTQPGEGFHELPFVKSVLDGDIYLEVARALGTFDKDDLTVRKGVRDLAKKQTMWFMYGDFSKHRPRPYNNFKKKFPFECQVMEKIKGKDHSIFPIILQAVEAHIVLERIVPRITKELPGVPIYTVHDSIITLHSHAKQVKEIMEEELLDFVGYPAVVKVESLSPDNPNELITSEASQMFTEIIESIHKQKKKQRPVGEFHFDTSIMNIPWKKIMPKWNDKTRFSPRFLDDEDESV